MSDTPRTDAVAIVVPLASSAGEGHRLYVDADFARQLERELAEAKRDALEQAAKALDAKAAHVKENSEALRKFSVEPRDFAEDEARCRLLCSMFLAEVADALRGFPSLNDLRAAIPFEEPK